jgi:hypothetical protein
MNARYVMCIDNEDYPIDLTPFKVYQVLPDEMGDEAGMIRIIDNTGEDYLYGVERFLPVELPAEAEEVFAKAVA